MLGLRFCARAFPSRGERGPLFIAVRGPLTIAAPPVAGHRLQTHRLSNCGSRAQSLRGMWDPPRPGLEPVSPALAGRFSTTAPPGKPMWVTLHSPCKGAGQEESFWNIPNTEGRSGGAQGWGPSLPQPGPIWVQAPPKVHPGGLLPQIPVGLLPPMRTCYGLCSMVFSRALPRWPV